ncbi:hypothetical protein [Flavilitoribacter nigricans]|uniref:Uncharacterized protein n=1 Tax=Flavilitoribacter nigricans (strain ATCC 23147 / DSM 23189 / NBRC 102662 / NCIMB 1420 / SS-2) TaxID=1122177 RepID=A0A2D0N755_FLAN2|nr:hypothetical protein [Flavilitoribacter nigricans]PHN04344.1 hypothetical protein CRP01_22545 [Flavilitoribacter nigricans DSM 23189 = NBRC 102662]
MDADKELLEGFNAGYIIEKYRPALSKQLVAAVQGVDLPFVEGFVAGTQEYTKERTQSRTIAKLRETSKGIPRPTKSKDRDEKDKGFEIDI